ncbi:MAG: hypothetical protein OXU45_08820 [Candidatus Melainabacteria bacterium]|nr:hypothetical protein [Candidatus Melainabacteria bacterium]
MVVYENSVKYRAEAFRTLGIILATPFGLELLSVLLGQHNHMYLLRIETLLSFCVMLMGDHLLQHGYRQMRKLDRERYARTN